MANNRVYLWCGKCNKHQFLAKCFGDGYLSGGASETQGIGELTCDFLSEHFWCNKEAGRVELRFEIHDAGRELPRDSVKEDYGCG